MNSENSGSNPGIWTTDGSHPEGCLSVWLDALHKAFQGSMQSLMYTDLEVLGADRNVFDLRPAARRSEKTFNETSWNRQRNFVALLCLALVDFIGNRSGPESRRSSLFLMCGSSYES